MKRTELLTYTQLHVISEHKYDSLNVLANHDWEVLHDEWPHGMDSLPHYWRIPLTKDQ